MEQKSIEQWIYHGKKNCKNYLFFQNKVLDLADFMSQHPGGLKAIKNYFFKDITNILFQVFPHKRETTIKKLSKYQVGLIPQEEAKKPKEKTQKNFINQDKTKQKKKVCFNSDHQNMKASIRINKSVKTQPLKHSQQHSLNKNNINQSIKKSKISKSSKSKSKKKQNLTSIRLINEEPFKTYDDYLKENEQKIKQKQYEQKQKRGEKKQKGLNATCSFSIYQIDEEKPNFRVPILLVKHMNRNG